MLSICVKITLLVLVLLPQLQIPKTRTTVAAVALDAVTALLMVSVSYSQHYRSPRPSTLLLLFLSLSLPLNGIRARTIWAAQTHLFCAVFIAGLGLDLVKLLLESVEQKPFLTNDAPESPLETIANVFNRSMFWWLNPLLIQGFQDVLEAGNLLSIDSRVNDAAGGDLFMRKWDAGLHLFICFIGYAVRSMLTLSYRIIKCRPSLPLP